MSLAIIPVLPGAPFQSLRTTLDGVTYGLELRWNRRGSLWLCDLYSAGGAALVHGRPVLIGEMLFRSYHHLAVPPGEVIAFDTELRDEDPTLEDLGTRIELVYLDRAELEVAGSLAEAVR
jgi:hypothetical protein